MLLDEGNVSTEDVAQASDDAHFWNWQEPESGMVLCEPQATIDRVVEQSLQMDSSGSKVEFQTV
jgi:hypothetical protein